MISRQVLRLKDLPKALALALSITKAIVRIIHCKVVVVVPQIEKKIRWHAIVKG